MISASSRDDSAFGALRLPGMESKIESGVGITGGMVSVVGELQGIAQDPLPQLEAIEQLTLSKGDDDFPEL